MVIDIDGFARRLDALIERLDAGGIDAGDVRTAIESLRTSAEELRAADDELVRRADDIALVHDELVAERDRYEQMFALAPDAFLITDLAGKIEDANVGAAALFGLERRFVIGKPLAVFVVPDARREFRSALVEAAAETAATNTRQRRFREFRFQRRGGSLFDAEVRVSVVSDRHRRPTGLRWIVHDVTEQRQAEAQLWQLNADLERRVAERAAAASAASRELAEKRAEFEAVLRQLPVGVLVVAKSGAVVARNRRASELFGMAVTHIDQISSRFLDEDGRPLGDVVRARENGGYDAESGDNDGHDAASEETPVTFVRPDGTRIMLEPRWAPVKLADAEVATAFVFDDVTTQRQRDIAQRAFIVNAAHELRTPLAAIVSAIEVLQAGAKNDVEARDVFLGHIQREADRLVRLARALLLLARAQAMDEAPSTELVPIRPLFEELAQAAHPAARVAIEIECDDDAAALTSPDLLRQALTSVLENAVRHTMEGAIVLRARLDADGTAVLEVEDSGPGMDEREKEVALHRFFRGAHSNAGFGLGLAIATEATRAAGGELTLDSELERGTTARIAVPAARLVTV